MGCGAAWDWGLLVGESWSLASYPLPLPSSLPSQTRGGRNADGEGCWFSGLGPQPRGGMGGSLGPSSALQTPNPLPSLPFSPQHPNPRQEKKGDGEYSDICASSSTCLPVCLPLCLWHLLDPAGCYVSTVTSGAASGWWAAARSPTG